MGNLKQTFNNLVSTMNYYDLYQKDDEVGIGLEELSNLIDEVEKRIECVKRTNVDSHEILFTNQVKLEESIGYDNVEILQRSVTDINIALDLNDSEPIENNWYSLFEEPKENVSRETLEEPPTSLCKTPQTHEFVKDIIAKLKVIDVDGETMQYILEQVGMEEQMLRQLIMSNPHTDTTDILEEKRILSNRGELYK
jgi:hypothetical protein